jgi:hypothetical protein
MVIQTRFPLSKSGYMMGIQCQLLLWTYYNRRTDIPEPSPAKQAIFDLGHGVGDLAKQIWPDGVEVEHDWDPEVTAARTRKLMARRIPIFEASFLSDRRYCRVDVLDPVDEDRWDLVEVKASTSVKPQYVHDVGFQADLLQRAGVRLRDLYLLHIDNQYVKRGPVEPDRLMRRERLTDLVSKVLDVARRTGDECLDVMDGPEPEIPVGRHCHYPYECPLVEKCHAFLPTDNPLTAYGLKRDKAYGFVAAGCERLVDVPRPELTEKQRIQQQSLAAGSTHVNPAGLREWLATLEYPVWHLDFETMSPAIPLLDGTRPFQKVPFQFSVHVQDRAGAAPTHFDFLATEPGDPRPALIGALGQIGKAGSVLAYNAPFEIGVLRGLGKTFPEHAGFCEGIVARMRDLLEPFRSFHLYHPDQRGSCSIKAVLPAFTLMTYSDLRIREGQQASREFERAVYGRSDDREQVLADLRAYCAQDTRAMVALLDEVYEYAK